MLYIKDGDRQVEWHVGELWPQLTGRVISFQMDGDEADFVLRAIEEKLSTWHPG